jgi:hypothetical protein
MFTFIESSAFEAVRPLYLDDDEYAELQQFMMQNPESGQVVPGSGGVRKVRWKRPGMGKRGGLRWPAGDLLCTVQAERILDVVHLRQGQAGRCPRTHPERAVGGIPKWVRN